MMLFEVEDLCNIVARVVVLFEYAIATELAPSSSKVVPSPSKMNTPACELKGFKESQGLCISPFRMKDSGLFHLRRRVKSKLLPYPRTSALREWISEIDVYTCDALIEICSEAEGASTTAQVFR
jgi:hypothetical protein